GGLFSQFSFCLQAILWFVFTFYAFKTILKKNYQLHFKFMVYSYAMTLSAISLRLFKWIIVNTLELGPMDTYKIVVWAGWLFNLMIAWLYLKFMKKNQLPLFK